MDWWRVYNRLVIPTIVILFMLLLLAFFWPGKIVVTCANGLVIEINDSNIDNWKELCADRLGIPAPVLPPEPLNLSTLRATGYTI